MLGRYATCQDETDRHHECCRTGNRPSGARRSDTTPSGGRHLVANRPGPSDVTVTAHVRRHSNPNVQVPEAFPLR